VNGTGSTASEGASPRMSAVDVRWRLLVSAAEDYEPMFHALWEFGVPDQRRSGAPPADEIKAALWALIKEGLIEVFQGLDTNEDVVPVPAHRHELFEDPNSWRSTKTPPSTSGTPRHRPEMPQWRTNRTSCSRSTGAPARRIAASRAETCSVVGGRARRGLCSVLQSIPDSVQVVVPRLGRLLKVH
jgi:hypothetical protein